MRLTFDTSAETLDDVLRVVGAAYNVTLAEKTGMSPTASDTRTSRRPPSATRSGGAAKRSTRNASKGSTSNASTIRQWAVDHGYEVSSRGAIPRAIADAYTSAHRG